MFKKTLRDVWLCLRLFYIYLLSANTNTYELYMYGKHGLPELKFHRISVQLKLNLACFFVDVGAVLSVLWVHRLSCSCHVGHLRSPTILSCQQLESIVCSVLQISWIRDSLINFVHHLKWLTEREGEAAPVLSNKGVRGLSVTHGLLCLLSSRRQQPCFLLQCSYGNSAEERRG